MSNKKLFPTIVWTWRIRANWTNWTFYDLECAINVSASFNSWEEVELVCGKGESLVLEKPGSVINMTIIKTKNPDLIWKLFNLAVSSFVWGENDVNEKVIFDENNKIEMLDRSNDDNWITTLVVKSSDWWTTYTLTDDYTIDIVENRTIITRVVGWDIPEWAEVLVTWKVNQNAFKEITLEKIQRVKQFFDLEIFWENAETKKMTSLFASPVKLNAEFLLEMKDAFKDWVPTWASLVFDLTDWGKIKLRDENI